MPLPRPSIVIKAFLLPELCTEAMEKEFKRSYMIIAQSIVAPLPEDLLSEEDLLPPHPARRLIVNVVTNKILASFFFMFSSFS